MYIYNNYVLQNIYMESSNKKQNAPRKIDLGIKKISSTYFRVFLGKISTKNENKYVVFVPYTYSDGPSYRAL